MLIPFGAPHIFETIKATTNLKGTFSKECRGINCIQIWLEIKKNNQKTSYQFGCWSFLAPFDPIYLGNNRSICFKHTERKFHNKSE